MQNILITGSTRGIGKGLAQEFLRLGHRVVVTGRSDAAVTRELSSLADPPDQIQATVDTNLLGTLYGCQVAIAGLRAQPGGGKVYTFEGFGSDILSKLEARTNLTVR